MQIRKFRLEKCSLLSIDQSIFVNFALLKDVSININNLRYLVHTSQMEWLSSLNSAVEFDLDHVNTHDKAIRVYVEQTHARIKIKSYHESVFPRRYFPYLSYDFPDEDFCLFASYPHDQLVVTAIQGKLDNCNRSCTLEWIYKYIPTYIHDLNQSVVYNLFFNSNNQSIACSNFWRSNKIDHSCDFDNLLARCKFNSTYNYEPEYFSWWNSTRSVVNVTNILVKRVGPIVSSLALVNNLLILLTFVYNKYHEKNMLEEVLLNNQVESVNYVERVRMNKYLQFNSILASLYSLFSLIELTIPCSGMEVYYLLDVAVTSSCFYKDLDIDIISSVLRLLSNLCLIQYALNRYALVDSDQKNKLVRLSHLSFRKTTAVGSLICCTLSVLVYFQNVLFRPDYLNDQDLVIAPSNQYNFYLMAYGVGDFNLKSLLDQKFNQIPLLFYLTLAYDMFSYALYCAAIIYIDIKTLIKLKEMFAHRQTIPTLIARKPEMNQVTIKSTVMVILNIFANVILRLPELISLVLFGLLILNDKGVYLAKIVCSRYDVCLDLLRLNKIFYMLYLSVIFYLELAFSSAFRLSFLKLVKIVK